MKKKNTAPKSAKQIAAQEALQTTWLLKGSLKNAQFSYLRVGKLLTQVREKKMYATLGHPDIEDYAEKRLQLGRSSLYKYLQVYDWVSRNHPEWLQPKPKGFIPDLGDIGNLMVIEDGLKQKNLSPVKRAKLQVLKDKVTTGGLKDSDMTVLKQRATTKGYTMQSLADNLKTLRRKASGIQGIPAEIIAHFDAMLAMLDNEKAVAHLDLQPSSDFALA